jgi:hypothetical protein
MTAHSPGAADGPAAAADRRAAVRTLAAELPRPIACRITPGRDVRVVNLSAAGMLVESTSPLFPGRVVKLHLQIDPQAQIGPQADVQPDRQIDKQIDVQIDTHRVTLNGTVVRGHMATADRDRGATFVSAIAFERRIDLARELTP